MSGSSSTAQPPVVERPLPVQYTCTSPVVDSPAGPFRWLLALDPQAAWLYKLREGQEPVLNSRCCCPTDPDPDDAVSPGQLPPLNAGMRNPRVASFSNDGRYLAISGEEKVLRVWALNDPDKWVLCYPEVKLLKQLPKRVAVMLWEESKVTEAQHLLVADRHGDVRVFSMEADALRPEDVAAAEKHREQRAAKKARVSKDEQDKNTEEHSEDVEDDEPGSSSDLSLRPRLGHVSMLCDVAFAPLPTASDPCDKEHPLIITSDRDEHIRVSRWGPERQAWIIERFLHGSKSFVGCIKTVQRKEETGEISWVLLSSDGGRSLRAWNYLEEAGSKQCFACVDVAKHMMSHLREEALKLKRVKGPKGPSGREKKEENGHGPTALSEEEEYNLKLAIVQLELLTDSSAASEGSSFPTHVLFRSEGGQAVFTLPLSSVFQSSDEGLQGFYFGRPILHSHVEEARDGAPQRIFVSLDCRQEFKALHEDADPSEDDVVALVFESGRLRLDEETQSNLDPLQSTSRYRSKGDSRTLNSLDLYPALQVYPKSSAEGGQFRPDMISRMAKGRRAQGRLRNMNQIFGGT